MQFYRAYVCMDLHWYCIIGTPLLYICAIVNQHLFLQKKYTTINLPQVVLQYHSVLELNYSALNFSFLHSKSITFILNLLEKYLDSPILREIKFLYSLTVGVQVIQDTLKTWLELLYMRYKIVISTKKREAPLYPYCRNG